MNLSLLQKISIQILARQIPEYKRYHYSKIDFTSKLIGIKGVRGAGKSTILLQFLNLTICQLYSKLHP